VTEQRLSPEIREALLQFSEYLSDKVPPLMVADAMSILIRHPARLAASEIHAWTSVQYRGEGSVIPLSDYLYHAVKKVVALGEYKLLPSEALSRWAADLSSLMLEICPDPDRPALQRNLAALGEAQTILSSPIEVVHRQAGSEVRLASRIGSGQGGTGGGSMTADVATSLRRFSAILDRFVPGDAGIERTPPPPEVQAQLVQSAVGSATTSDELDHYLARAGEIGVDVQPRQLFRMLGQALPPWVVPLGEPHEGEAAPLAGPAEAMERLVKLADGPAEGARRFREMVRAAIDEFNAGSVARAATMLELAERIAAEQQVDPEVVGVVRATEHDNLDSERLRKQMENRESHFLLRRILKFFTPWDAEALLKEVRVEQKRDRRRAILAMLEVYGPSLRNRAIELLEQVVASGRRDENQFFARNLLYLLNRIPRSGERPLDEEIDLLAGLSSTTWKPIVVREAVAVLAQIHHERSEKILVTRLSEIEAMLLGGSDERYPPHEARQLLDRITAALGRLGTPGALHAVIEHALRPNEQFGDRRSRLSALAQHDLSQAPEALTRLIEAIRSELPRRMLGIMIQKRSVGIGRMIDALASTDAPAVRELLEEIADRYSDHDFAGNATTILEQAGATPRWSAMQSGPMLTGDLEVLGLPTLLQNLAELQLSGTLSIIDSEDRTISTITLARGRIVRSARGMLSGQEALFQIFEQSRPATFSFVSHADAGEAEAGWDVAPLVYEAMRRHDDLNRAMLLVPRSARLHPTGAKPVPHPQESDPMLVRSVWVRAASGDPPAKWESEVNADAFRIWRLLEHWVDNGALEVRRAGS
jgi:hypothetical protein